MAITIAVAGKGGTGKTTIAALIIQYLVEQNKGSVLAIDADPDANLGTVLGIKPDKSIGELRDEVLKEIKNFPAGMDKANYVEAGLHQIIEEAKGYDLITMGRGEGSGCYCYLNTLIRKFHEDLEPSYKWIVMDNEAGLEHISRRTTSNIDHLFIVVSGNPVSLQTAEKIDQISKDLKNEIKNKYLISNMVREKNLNRIKEWADEHKINYVGNLPRDEILEDAVLEGEYLTKLTNSPAKESIFSIMNKIGGNNGNS
jgi:CO dehydrogenase maturation factor